MVNPRPFSFTSWLMLRLTWALHRPDMFISILVLAGLGVCALIWFGNRTRTRRARIRIIILVLALMLALIWWWLRAGWDKWSKSRNAVKRDGSLLRLLRLVDSFSDYSRRLAVSVSVRPHTYWRQLCVKVAVSVIGPPIVIEAGLFVPEKEPVPLPLQLRGRTS